MGMPMISVPRVIEYATLISMVFGAYLWVTKTVATKTDVLIAMNNIEAGRISSDLKYYQRLGTDSLLDSDKESYEELKEEQAANDAQKRRLLGLD